MSRRALTLLGALLLAAACATALSAPTAEDRRTPAQRLADLYSSPIADPMRGRLYGKVAALLDAARQLPDRIELPETEAPAPDPEPQSPAEPDPVPEPTVAEQAATAEPAAAVKPGPEPEPPVPGEDWRVVSGEPVVADEDLAHAHFRAGFYRRAASLYGRLSKADPEDAHLMVMLALSERNAGDAAAARDVLDQLRSADEDPDTWAAWFDHMVELGTPEEESQ